MMSTDPIAETLARAGLDEGPGPYPSRGKPWRLKGATDRSPPLFMVHAPDALKPWLGRDGWAWADDRAEAGRWPEDQALALLHQQQSRPNEFELVPVGSGL